MAQTVNHTDVSTADRPARTRFGAIRLRRDDPRPASRLMATPDEFPQADEALQDQLITWAASPERGAYLDKRRNLVAPVMASILVVLAGVLVLGLGRGDRVLFVGGVLCGLGGCALLYLQVPYWSLRIAFAQRRRATAAAKVDVAIDRLCRAESDLPLPELFELNRRQLDKYQELTRRQQQATFVASQVAGALAFLALLAGVIISLRYQPGSGTYVAAGLSGLGAALSTFLSSTFYAGHRQANKQLRLYYLEPQRTGRLLAAERLLRIKPAMPADAAKAMVDRLMTWELPGHEAPAATPKAPQP